MRAPIRPLPDDVARWIAYGRYLRWLDAAAAWLATIVAVTAFHSDLPLRDSAVVAAVLVVVVALIPAFRVRWRPVSAVVGLAVSRSLRPGDRAWFVGAAHAEPVLVTGRRGIRVVIARPDQGEAEGISVRRTRVFLLPLEVRS